MGNDKPNKVFGFLKSRASRRGRDQDSAKIR